MQRGLRPFLLLGLLVPERCLVVGAEPAPMCSPSRSAKDLDLVNSCSNNSNHPLASEKSQFFPLGA